ncbi:MAG: hypothetical protein JXR14_14155 [Paracoccaceae bacterium]
MADNQDALFQRLEQAVSHDPTALEEAAELLSAGSNPALAGPKVTAQDIGTADGIVHLVDRVLPGWTIQMTGTASEPDGHWHCTLRQSAIRDNDEFIGRGEGKILSHALLAALLRTLRYRAGRTSG